MKYRKGFTMIELLAVLLILGIIALIAVPTVNTLIQNTENRAIEASLINMEQAVRLYRLDRGERDPESLTQVFVRLENRALQGNNAVAAEWEQYADALLGPYISGDWPTPPFGGIYSYRFYANDESFAFSTLNPNTNSHSKALRELRLNAEGILEAGRSLNRVFDLPADATGEFLKIRFGETPNRAGEGLFDLNDNQENTEAFIRTVEFLLQTEFADRLFVYHNNRPNNTHTGITPINRLLDADGGPEVDNRRAQLVIMIYLDHHRWPRND